jgi:TRAP-type mannitol/chloroaromatic compound transport system permease small subunit
MFGSISDNTNDYINQLALGEPLMKTDTAVARYGQPAPLYRLFGWTILTVLAAFLTNNIVMLAFKTAPVSKVLSGGGLISTAIYAAFIFLGVAYVVRSPDRALRWDAHRLHKFNVYLVRGFFWAVMFVGVVDATIAFMRVENLFPAFLGEDFIKKFSLARFVGPNIHIPLIMAGFIVALFSRTVGFTWLALAIVAAELLIVISRFVFSYEQALMGDLVRYWYAALFLFASAYTLFDDGHVRVDVFYANFSSRKRGIVNAIGATLLGISTCWVIIYIGLNGKTAIINSPIVNFEISQVGTVGMFIKYQMAGFLAVFAVTMLIQFVSYFFEAIADYRDEPGHRTAVPIAQ